MDETKYYDEMRSICNGQVLLFTIKGSKRGRWNARISLPGRKGYIRRSMKTANLEAARFQAEKLYLELRAKYDQRLPLDGITFEQAWQRYMDHRLARGRNNKRQESVYRRYLKPFFVDRLKGHPWNVSTLAEYRSWHFDEYFKPGGWRMTYWDDREPEYYTDVWGRNHQVMNKNPKAPGRHSLNLEKYALMGMFELAREHGYIGQVPSMPPPAAQRQSLNSPRGFFNIDEYRELVAYLRYKCERMPVSKNNRFQMVSRWRAERMRAWVLLQSATGLRSQEMSRLRWKHLKLYEKAGREYTLVDLPADITKSKWAGTHSIKEARKVFSFDGRLTYDRVYYRWGMRWCQDKLIGLPPDEKIEWSESAHPYGMDESGWIPKTWQGRCTFNDPDALIFPCHRNPEKVANMGNHFYKVLREIGLETDEDGRQLCLTSLRHFFVTQRLSDGVPPAIIATNCGHSHETLWRVYNRMMMNDVVEWLQLYGPSQQDHGRATNPAGVIAGAIGEVHTRK